LSPVTDAASSAVGTLTKLAVTAGVIYLAVMFAPPLIEMAKKALEKRSA